MARTPEDRLRNLNKQHQDAIYRLLLDGQVDVQRRLQQAVDSGADGTARKLKAIQAQIKEALLATDTSAKAWAVRATREVYRGTLNVVDAHMGRTIGGTITGEVGFDAPLHVEALDLLAQAAYTPFSDHLGRIGRQVDDAFQRAQVDKARAALLGAETASSMERRLRDTLQGQGYFDFTDKSGRVWGLKRYTDMVSRTILREAETQGSANRMAQMGVTLGLVSTDAQPCSKCVEWQDTLLSLDGNQLGDIVEGRLVKGTIESARAAGLWHPNCRHNILPWVSSIDDMIADLEQRLGEGSVDVKKTPPPAPVKVQPTTKGLLDTECARIGKMDHEELVSIDPKTGKRRSWVGDGSSVDIPEADERSLKGMVVLHNHPGGSSFSNGDILTAAQLGVGEMHVIGSTGNRYAMLPPDGGWLSAKAREGKRLELSEEVRGAFSKLKDVDLSALTELDTIEKWDQAIDAAYRMMHVERYEAETHGQAYPLSEFQHRTWEILSSIFDVDYIRTRGQ